MFSEKAKEDAQRLWEEAVTLFWSGNIDKMTFGEFDEAMKKEIPEKTYLEFRKLMDNRKT